MSDQDIRTLAHAICSASDLFIELIMMLPQEDRYIFAKQYAEKYMGFFSAIEQDKSQGAA